MTNIKLTEEQEHLVKMCGKCVVTESGAEYIFIPYWFRKKDGEWEVFPLDPMHLPIELREHLTKQRHKK